MFLQILHFTGSYNLRLAKNILGNNSRIKILTDLDFIFIFFTLFSSFPLDYSVWYINIKVLGLKI